MDQSTNKVRLENWTDIISKCQSRPEGQTAKQWLAENGIPDKQYYYWLRKIRKQTYDDLEHALSIPDSDKTIAVSLAEIPVSDILPDRSPAMTAMTIKTRRATIEITTAVSDAIMAEIIKAVGHAL